MYQLSPFSRLCRRFPSTLNRSIAARAAIHTNRLRSMNRISANTPNSSPSTSDPDAVNSGDTVDLTYFHTFVSQKPDSPYKAHKILEAQSHNPGQPPERQLVGAGRELKDAMRQHHFNHKAVDLCVLHPPSLGALKPGMLRFEIVKMLRHGDGCHAQIAIVKVLRASPPLDVEGYVVLAKIYDPLYWNWMDAPGTDPFMTTQSEYAHEYEALRKLQKLEEVPRLFGAFSASIPLANGGKRPVRMILKEFVPGTVFSNLDVSGYTEEAKKAILAAIMKGYSTMAHMGVRMGDLSPNNAILVDFKEGKAKVRYIDFGRAYSTTFKVPSTYYLWNTEQDEDALCGFDFLVDGWKQDYNEWLGETFGSQDEIYCQCPVCKSS